MVVSFKPCLASVSDLPSSLMPSSSNTCSGEAEGAEQGTGGEEGRGEVGWDGLGPVVGFHRGLGGGAN